MSRIRIVRNSAGNCINFVGTTNPTYWNACLRGEVNADDATRVNVVNTVQSYGSETAYEFYAIPYYRFCDADGNDFANAQECADYITAQANVSGATAGYELTDQDQLGFRRDPTDTTIIISDGEYYPVNILLAEDAGDGTITIREEGDNGNILYTGLRPANASINGVAVNPVLADAVNELNALFNVETIVSPGVTTIINNYYYLGDDTITPFGTGNERNPPWFEVPDLDSDGNENNNGFTTNATGDYFIWAGPASNPNDPKPYSGGDYLVGIVPADQDVTDLHTDSSLTEDLTWWVEVTSQGYTENAGSILNPDTLTSGVAYGSGSSIATQFRIGRSTDNRLIVEGTTIPWGTTPTESDWFEIIRTNTTVSPSSKWRLVWKAVSDGACINTNTIIAVDSENSLTYYYIESPDTVFYYPIFTTASEAAYYDADLRFGGQYGGDGTYTAVTFEDVPGNIVYYIPNHGSTIDGTFSTTQGPLHPATGNGYDAAGTYWTEIPTEADNLHVPIQFTGSDYIFNEGDGVNIVITTDGAYTTTITGLPTGLTYANGNITGSAPDVSGTTLTNQYDSFTVTVTRTNTYGSSAGTFNIQVNNLTASPQAITGWVWDDDSEELIDESTLDEGSVTCVTNKLLEDYRMIFSKTWINTNVLPYLQEAGDVIYIGVVRAGMNITDYEDPANVSDLDWEAYISFEYVSPSSHRSTLYGYNSGTPQKNQVLSASLNTTTYDFAFENNDHNDLYVLGASTVSLNNEKGIAYGGSVARSVETSATGEVEICMVTVGCNAKISNPGVDIIRIPLGGNFIRINEPTEAPETYTFDTATATGQPDMPTLQAGQTYTFDMGSNSLTGLDFDDLLCFTLDGGVEYTAVARAAAVGTEINPTITGVQNILINGRNVALADALDLAGIISAINLELESSPAINVIASNNGTGQLRLRVTNDTESLILANNGGTGLEQLGLAATTVVPSSGLIRNGVPGEAGTTVTFVVPIDVPVPLYWHIGTKDEMDPTTVEEAVVTGSIWPEDLDDRGDDDDSTTPVVDPDPDNLFPAPVIGIDATSKGLQNGTAIELGLLQRGQRMVFSHDFIRHLMDHMPTYEEGGTDTLRDKNRIYIGIIADEAYETNIYGTSAMLETRLSTARYPNADTNGWGAEEEGMGSAIFGNNAMWFEKSAYNYTDHTATANYDPTTQGTHQARGFFTTAMNLGRISNDPGTEDTFDEWAYSIEFSPESGDNNLYYVADPDENLLYTLPGEHTNHQEWSIYDSARMSDVLGGGSTSGTQLSVAADWRRYFSQTEENNGNDPWLLADPSTTPATYGYRVVLIAEGPNDSFADIDFDMNGVEIIPIPVANPVTQVSTHAWDGKGSNYWIKDNNDYAQGGITLTEHSTNVFYSDQTTSPSAPNSTNATSPDGYPWAFASVFQMEIPTPTTKQTLFTSGADPLKEHGVFSVMFDGHYLQLLMGAGGHVYISEKPDFYFRQGDWYGLYIDYNGDHVMAGTNTSFRIHNVNLSTGNSHSIELDFNEFRKAGWDDVPNAKPTGETSNLITYSGVGLNGNQCVGVYPVQTLSTDNMTRTNYWLGNIAQITQTTLPVNSVLPTDHEIALMTRDPMTWITEYKETGSLNNSAGTYRLPANNTNSTGFATGTGDNGYHGVQVYRFGDGLPDGETFSANQIPNEIYSNQENTPTRLGGVGNTTGCIINVTIPGITVDPNAGGGGGGGGSTGSGWSHLEGSPDLIDSNTLAPGSIMCFDTPLTAGNRVVFDDDWIDSIFAALPDTVPSIAPIWIGVLASNANPSNVEYSSNFDLVTNLWKDNTQRIVVNQVYRNPGDNMKDLIFFNDEPRSGQVWMRGYHNGTTVNTPRLDIEGGPYMNAHYGEEVKIVLVNGTGQNVSIDFANSAVVVPNTDSLQGDNLTTWTKALSFSGSQYAQQKDLTATLSQFETRGWHEMNFPLSMAELAITVPGHSTDSTKTSNYSTVEWDGQQYVSEFAAPWATSIMFRADLNNSDQIIWNHGEGNNTGDDNIFLHLSASGELTFNWGREGSGYNKCVINSNLASSANWYGVYIAHTGERLSSADATATNLAGCFDIRIMSSADNFASVGNNLSTSSNWTSTGVQMDRAVLGEFTIAGRGTTGSFYGEVAGAVATTLNINTDMPSDTEISRIITDPVKWMNNHKRDTRTRYPYGTGTLLLQSRGFQSAQRHQIWLMGDLGVHDGGSQLLISDNYPQTDNDMITDGVQNKMGQIGSGGTDGASNLELNNMTVNDIVSVNIPGLSDDHYGV